MNQPAKRQQPDLPPDNGKRARVDPATGEVRGAGSGAGGGNAGEDFDSDPATGSGYPQTGADRQKRDRKQ
ncbi:hypothetical protein [Sphingomonas lycopersici]|uniref:Uncharacterized protein n=1 Tax=Sphingomonas lycopersici TaxID=2951807 RepID=A0AA41ZCR3_9SPHN|nr:hypothetical protein [Sphingomonas lycopersici]MCW6534236.1 hypothetical protein [Sphingomonas lycopersici]